MVDSNGLVKMPVYSVNGTEQRGVDQAISALDNTLHDAVMYDGVKDSVSLGGSNGTRIHNVATATAGTDAVNFNQLLDAGLKADTNGAVTNSFVAYDDKTKKDSVTLGDTLGAGAQIHKVVAGSADQDAVNLKQLKDAGIDWSIRAAIRPMRLSHTTRGRWIRSRLGEPTARKSTSFLRDRRIRTR